MVSRTLHLAMFLAPNRFSLYAFIARYVQARPGIVCVPSASPPA
jgi:hypothetical protein